MNPEISYQNLGWNDRMVPTIVDALQYIDRNIPARGCVGRQLNFTGNDFTAAGKQALLKAFPKKTGGAVDVFKVKV